jgi:hypothetical protein
MKSNWYVTPQQKIEFEQENIFLNGTEKKNRYESYKKARTVQEFFRLGGKSEEIVEDYHCGLVTIK